MPDHDFDRCVVADDQWLQIGECKAAALAVYLLLHEHIAVHERDRCLVSYYGNGLGRRRSEEEFLELRIAHVLGDRRDVDDNLARVDDQACVDRASK
jgi:hypothetical protein